MRNSGTQIAPPPPPVTHELEIKKINNRWKVVIQGTTTTTVKAKRGERIVWTAKGTDAYFQFIDTTLFGGFTKSVKAGQKLNLPIGKFAKLGTNVYSVFCYAEKEYAEGDSPPKIIIE
ncbi:MAG: hypothetical protein FJ215_12595 [Ignavibacteria bacterium]|nr:hypothetical protein [Ignavibacteria bacterium]